MPSKLRQVSGKSPMTTVVFAAFTGGLYLFVMNTMPLILGAIADHFDASLFELGIVNSLYGFGVFSAFLLAPVWLKRIRFRLPVIGGAALLFVSFLVLPYLPHITFVIVLFGFLGFAAGSISAQGNSTIGQSNSPPRWFGVSALFQLILAILYAMSVPLFIIPSFGSAAGLQVISLVYLPALVLPLVISLPSMCKPTQGDSPPRITLREAWRAGSLYQQLRLATAFFALTIYILPAAAYWIFSERIGTSYGLEKTFISATITAGLVAAMAGGLLFQWQSKRASNVAVISLTLVISSYLLMINGTAASFSISVMLFNLGWGALVPAFNSIIQYTDFTKQLYASAGGALTIGALLAGPPAAMIVEQAGFSALLMISCPVTGVALACVLFAARGGDNSSLAPSTSH